ncbi:hypothetical protein BDZ97DRAFT_1407037 [Flammula alnicola]|nr:hypothetical protein BDZ97DRAFT_1407037 [Flammula alnicola]
MPPTATKSNWKPVNPPGSSFPRAVPDDPCNTSLPVPFMNVRPMVFEREPGDRGVQFRHVNYMSADPAFPPQGGGTRNLPKDITWAHVDPSQTPGRSHADKSYQVTWAQEKHTSAKRKEMLSKQSVRVKKPKPSNS